MNGGQADYSEASAIILILFVFLLYYLYHYHFEYFLYIWVWPITAFFQILKYTPSFITDIIFFWDPNSVKPQASSIVNGMLNPLLFGGEYPSFFGEGYQGKKMPESLHQRFVLYADQKPMVFLVNSYSGFLLNFYVMLYLFWKSIVIFNRKKYNNSHSMESLAIQESELWPQIKPVIFDNPLRFKELDEGKWAMAQKPDYFSRKNNLINTYENELGEEKFTIYEDRTFKVFLKQLGTPWKSINSLSNVEKQIFAILISQAMRDGKTSLELRKNLGHYYTSKKSIFDFFKNRKKKKEVDKMVNSVIKKYSQEEYVKNIINKHFYVKTVFAGLLKSSRVDGVLSNSEFLWLKLQDRDLWYVLCNVGRKSAFVECAGVWSHFLFEEYVERKISNPMVKNAVKALDLYFYESSDSYERIVKEEN